MMRALMPMVRMQPTSRSILDQWIRELYFSVLIPVFSQQRVVEDNDEQKGQAMRKKRRR